MFEKLTITRQDGKEIEILADNGEIDGKITRFGITHYGEAYLLSVTDAQSEVNHIVGIFYDKANAYDAAESMKTRGIVTKDGDKILSAAEFLKTEGKLGNSKQERELRGITALEYLNGEEPEPF